MKLVGIFFAMLLVALLLSSDSQAKLLYENDFEYLDEKPVSENVYLFPWPMDYEKTLMNYQGGCYRTSAGDDFNNFSLTDKDTFSGERAFIVRTITNYPTSNSPNCPWRWLGNEIKARNEVAFGHPTGNQTAPEWGHVAWDYPGFWYSYAVRIPSNQPGLKTWIDKDKPRVIMTQLLGSQNGATPELHFMMGGNNGKPQITAEVTSSNKAQGENLVKTDYVFDLSLDDWHVINISRKRRWDGSGELKIYLDCHNQPTNECKPLVDHAGANAIRDKPISIFKFGLYRSDVNSGVDQIAVFDALKVHSGDTTLNDVLDDYRSAPPPTALPYPPLAPKWSDY